MDLKRVELAAYNGLPHLLVPVITEPERAKAALKWAVNEMEARYRRFAGATARNIRAFNETRADPEDRMPYIVIVIDELADLMMREGKNVEDPIVRLAQKARATGIHMVLATQRPSVNVVTGLIKANFPSRIAFAMASQIDSRTILDAPGAEDLIGRGDMLYQPSDLPRPMRLQGVFVSDAEIGRVVDHWKDQIDDPHYDMAIIDERRRVDGLGRRPRRRGRRPAAARCRRGHSGVRSCLGVAPPAPPQGRLRAGRPDDRPAGGAGVHRRVRRLERPAGPPPRRARRRRRPDDDSTGTTDDDARAAQAARSGRPVATPAAGASPTRARACPSACTPRASARASTSTAPSATRRSGPATSARSSGATTRSCRAPSTRRASCATTRSTSGSTPTRSSRQWRRERGDGKRAAAGDRRPAADRGAAPGPDVLAGHRRRGAADRRRRRLRRVPRRPAAALRQAADDRGHPARRRRSSTSTSRRPRTRLRGHDAARARRSRSRRPGREPVPGDRRRPTATWAADVDLRRGRNQFDVNALDPETGKHSEDTVRVFITVPFLVDRGADADGRPAGRGRDVRERRDPGRGHGDERRRRSSSARRTSARPDRRAGGRPGDARRRRPTPAAVTVKVGEDGTFSTPLELTAGQVGDHRHRAAAPRARPPR